MRARRLERSARRLLDRLHEQIGTGLLAAKTVPGLAAVVDQHAAAIRDIVTSGAGTGGGTSAAVARSVLLAGYAQGVLDHVREKGWQLRVPADSAGWASADWFSVRLVAVLTLARSMRPGHASGSGAVDGLPSLA